MTFTKDNYFEIHPNSLIVLKKLLNGCDLMSTYRDTFHKVYLSIYDTVPEDEIPGICQELLEYDLLEIYEVPDQKDYEDHLPTGTFRYKCNLKGRRYIEYTDQIQSENRKREEELQKERQGIEDAKIVRKIYDKIKSTSFDLLTPRETNVQFSEDMSEMCRVFTCDVGNDTIEFYFIDGKFNLDGKDEYTMCINGGDTIYAEEGLLKEVFNTIKDIHSLQEQERNEINEDYGNLDNCSSEDTKLVQKIFKKIKYSDFNISSLDKEEPNNYTFTYSCCLSDVDVAITYIFSFGEGNAYTMKVNGRKLDGVDEISEKIYDLMADIYRNK